MAHTQDILDYVSEWHTKRFRVTEITLTDAASSLETDDPLVVARPGNSNSRWMLFNLDTNKPAVLCHAGIWAWRSDLNTGNFVPEGQAAPEGLPENRIQTVPSFKCEFSYAFDTSADSSIWSHMQILENHVSAQPNFNKGNRPRRAWQNGNNPAMRQKYIMTAKVFTRRSPLNSKEGGEYDVPYDVHPWISNAIDDFPEAHQIPNPERPRYYDYTDNVLKNLEDTNNPTFAKNDIVWFSFRVAFVVSGDSWSPEIIPIEFIRVDRIPEHLVTKSDPSMYPPLDADHEPLELGGPVSIIDGPSRQAKRKVLEDDFEDSSRPTKKQSIDSDSEMGEVNEATPPPAQKRTSNSSTSSSKTRLRSGKENRPVKTNQ